MDLPASLVMGVFSMPWSLVPTGWVHPSKLSLCQSQSYSLICSSCVENTGLVSPKALLLVASVLSLGWDLGDRRKMTYLVGAPR